MTAFAIVLRGPLGMTKAAVARALARRLGGLHISVDEVLESYGLDEGDADGIPLRNFVRSNVLAMPVARRALTLGQPVVFDGAFYYEEQIDHLVDSLIQTTALASPPIVITLVVPLEICIVSESETAACEADAAEGSREPGPVADVTEAIVAQVMAALAPYLPADARRPEALSA